MTPQVVIAIGLAVVASFCFAIGAILQHHGIGNSAGESESNDLTIGRFKSMLRDRWWLGGSLIVALGALMHLIGVSLAPVSVVQPIGILAVPISVIITARLRRQVPNQRMIIGIVLAVVGLVLFTWFVTRDPLPDTVIHPPQILIGAVITLAVAFACIIPARRGPKQFRTLCWAAAGSIIYGLSTALMKVGWTMFNAGQWAHPYFWFTLVGIGICYLVGMLLIQQGHAVGAPEIVVGAMTVVDPLTAVAYGIAVLGEGSHLDAVSATGMAAMGALAAFGVFLLSKYHPDAHRSEAGEQLGVAEAALKKGTQE